jgi:hypothetical protein
MYREGGWEIRKVYDNLSKYKSSVGFSSSMMVMGRMKRRGNTMTWFCLSLSWTLVLTLLAPY